MTAVTIVSVLVLLSEIIFVFYFIKQRKHYKIMISKQTVFWFIPVLIFLFTLYLTGYLYQEKIGVLGIIDALVAAIKSFAFEVKSAYVKEVLSENVFFSIAFYSAYLLAVITVVSTAFNLFRNHIKNHSKVSKLKKSCVDVVIGYNEASVIYAKNHLDHTVMLLDMTVPTEVLNALYEAKIAFIKTPFSVEGLEKKKFNKEASYHFIAFESLESQYQALMDQMILIKRVYEKSHLYLEVKYQEMDVVKKSLAKHKTTNPNSYIHTFSRYELISRKFVTEVTVPSLLPESFFNDNRSIKEDHEINVFFFGFGKVNASLFTLFCQNNMLTTTTSKGLKAKPINYYMIDQDHERVNDKRIDYLLSTYQTFDSDFPPVEKMCNYHKIIKNLNSSDAIHEMKGVVKKEHTFNLFIVSHGTDYENAETSLWLKQTFRDDDIKIACRLQNARIVDEDIIAFGQVQDMLSHDYIVDEKLQSLAKEIHEDYQKTAKQRGKTIEIPFAALPQIELFSSYYNAMNIPFKLHVLGLDLVKGNDPHALTKEQFMAIYGKIENAYDYDDYFKETKRNVIAYGEKLRWNAFYIFEGYQPMKLSEIAIEGNRYIRKDPLQRKHACLTSHRGLDQLHQAVYQKMKDQGIKVSLKEIETYGYDYMVFDQVDDNLFDKLTRLGYAIVQLKKKG